MSAVSFASGVRIAPSGVDAVATEPPAALYVTNGFVDEMEVAGR
jgi:hypothetical protein